jgi:hypothetical protein
MFEKQLALEKAQGYRGLATRLVGPILDVREAEVVIRETCFTLVGISAVFVVIAFKHGVANLVLAAVLGLPALITALTRSRVAAVILDLGVLVFGGLYILVLPSNTWRLLFSVLLVLMAARASEAAFKRRRLLLGVDRPPVAFTPPSPPAV